MFDLDKWQEIFSTIQRNKLRTFLTAFGVFWGILMLVLLLAAGDGLQNGIEKGFSSDLRNSLWVVPQKTSKPYKGMPAGRFVQFTEEDIDHLSNEIDNKKDLSPETSYFRGSWEITRNNKQVTYEVLGVGPTYFDIKVFQEYVAGRRLNINDHREKRKVVVVGLPVAEGLFDHYEEAVGEYIYINSVAFKVVGVFKDPGFNGRQSERAYMPFDAYNTSFNPQSIISVMALVPKDGVSGQEVAEKVRTVLGKHHQFDPEDRQALYIMDMEENAKEIQGLFMGINGLIWFVGIGTLIAGIIGISNIMLIIVKDRTNEIGIRKAVGAKPWSVIGMILQESIFLTGVAGYFGLVVGVAMLEGANYMIEKNGIEMDYFYNPNINFKVCVTATVILVISGAIAGFIPARKAAKIKPVEAMRA